MIKQVVSLPSWSLKSSRAGRHKSIKIIDEHNVADGISMLLRASRLVYPSPTCCQPNSSHLQPCACPWATEIVSKLRSSPLSQTDWSRIQKASSFASRQDELHGAVPACHLNYIFAQAFRVLSYFLHPLTSFSQEHSLSEPISCTKVPRLCFWETWLKVQYNSW